MFLMFVGMFITAALPLLQAYCSAFGEFPATWMPAKKKENWLLVEEQHLVVKPRERAALT